LEDGDGRVLLQPIAIDLGLNYVLRIEIQGSNFTAYFDGQKVLSWTDSSYSSGLIGVKVKGASVGFDNFKVYLFESIPSPLPAPAFTLTANATAALIGDVVRLTGTLSVPKTSPPTLTFKWSRTDPGEHTESAPNQVITNGTYARDFAVADAGTYDFMVTWPGDATSAPAVSNTVRVIVERSFTSMTIIVPDDYPTIQAAINAADAGDTVYVRKGGYGGPVYVNKPVALVGENKSSTSIGAPYQGIAVIVSADNVTITGFTMLPSGAARISTSALVLSNVKGVNISGNNIGGGAEYGVSLVVESSSNCIFSENTIVPSYYGIALQLSSSSVNTFFRNNIYGISLDASFNNWNSTYSLGGNYYGATGVDLKKGPNQDQPGGDGFGDTPYVINANNTDYYPLTRPYTYFTEGRPFAQFNCSSTTPLADETVTFDASASVDRNGNIVKYFWDFGDGTNASSASPVVTYVYGTVLWRTVKLTITDNDGLTDTSTQLLDVRWVPASLSFSTSASSMFAGFKVDLAGTLRDVHGNGLIGKTIALSYTVSGIITWTPITSCVTDNAGNYLATWIPTPTGTFSLKVEWGGDSTHAGLSSTATLNCLSNDQYVFSVESASTISNLAFNAANRVLSFTATGSDGTQGYVRASVAKNFTANPDGVKVLIDGNQVTCSPTLTSDSCLIYFTYQHSSHSVIIDLSAAAQPTPTPTPSTTATPTPTPTPTSSSTPTPTPTSTPTSQPTSNPTSTPTPGETPLTNWILYLIPSAIVIVIIALVLAWRRKKLHKLQTT
jgi:parallel beta-helix repeat protein